MKTRRWRGNGGKVGGERGESQRERFKEAERG